MSEPIDRLTAGLDPEQQESLGDLRSLRAQLDTFSVPEPSSGDTARLLTHLEPYLSRRAAGLLQSENHSLFAQIQPWLRLAWSQATLLERSFWWASGMILLLGIFLAFLVGDGFLAVALVFLSPALAAAGVAYAFRPATQTLWELEKITPIHPMELLYARLALVLGFNVLLALALLCFVWLGEPQMVVWRLLFAWLGPLLALSGVALYTTVRWGSLPGTILPIAVWGGLVSLGWWQAVERAEAPQLAAVWLAEQLSHSDPLLAAFLLALGLGAILLWQSAHLAGGDAYQWN